MFWLISPTPNIYFLSFSFNIPCYYVVEWRKKNISKQMEDKKHTWNYDSCRLLIILADQKEPKLSLILYMSDIGILFFYKIHGETLNILTPNSPKWYIRSFQSKWIVWIHHYSLSSQVENVGEYKPNLTYIYHQWNKWFTC